MVEYSCWGTWHFLFFYIVESLGIAALLYQGHKVNGDEYEREQNKISTDRN